MLLRVESEGAYASDALHLALGLNVKPADAALATEITMGALRWQAQLDFLLGTYLNKPVSKLDEPVAIALRMGLYQLRHLERIPAPVAVDESVKMVKGARKASAASLVNAVLRKAAADACKPAENFLPATIAPIQRLSILYSHPAWLVKRWLARLGESETVALLKANNQPPHVTCAPTNPKAVTALFSELTDNHLRVESGRLLRDSLSVSGGSISRTRAFREGRLSIQDEASQTVPLLLNVQAGDRVLDLCAAPGGKTVVLARNANFVVAGDLHPHRLRAANGQFARLHMDKIFAVALDATRPLPFSFTFDRILVDAPCSGTGTLSRHPEIRWRLEPAQLAEFHRLQVTILRNAITQATPGGSVLYSTCSLEPEENEEVVEAVLREAVKSGRKISRAEQSTMAAALRPHLAASVDPLQLVDSSGAFHTFPPRDHTDGFFAALLQIEE